VIKYLTLLALVAQASAATLTVGPDQQFKLPSEAARATKTGDVVRIAPGTYRDCSVWWADKLTIEGSGAVITGNVCGYKALFVISGNDTTIRGITFTGATSPAGNGAGIRAEGTNLTIEDATFTDNQDGVLAGEDADSTITIRNSTFDGNGACEPNMGCAHGVYVGHIALLHIEHSRFTDTKVGHHIKSRAWRTEIVDNHIEDGPQGTSSYLVDLPEGGSLELRDNTLEKGPLSQNHLAAVSIGEEKLLVPVKQLLLSGNVFTNDGRDTYFLRNETPVPAILSGNEFKGHKVTPLHGSGVLR
jgi:nitrous oxidase accessory protein NosD